MKNTQNIGFTIGKFAPLHIGHQMLINQAISEIDKFIVIIYQTHVTNVPLKIRANWIKDIYKDKVEVIVAKDPPNEYGLDETSTRVQTDYIKKLLKNRKVTHFYCAEKYGTYVAKHLNVIDRRIEKLKKENEDNLYINATLIRKDPKKYKDMVNEQVFKDILKYEKI